MLLHSDFAQENSTSTKQHPGTDGFPSSQKMRCSSGSTAWLGILDEIILSSFVQMGKENSPLGLPILATKGFSFTWTSSHCLRTMAIAQWTLINEWAWLETWICTGQLQGKLCKVQQTTGHLIMKFQRLGWQIEEELWAQPAVGSNRALEISKELSYLNTLPPTTVATSIPDHIWSVGSFVSHK